MNNPAKRAKTVRKIGLEPLFQVMQKAPSSSSYNFRDTSNSVGSNSQGGTLNNIAYPLSYSSLKV